MFVPIHGQMKLCMPLVEDSLEPSESLLEEVQETTQQPHLHADFGDIFFFRQLRTLFIKAGYMSFSLSDLHAPAPKRLRVQLSALFNLGKFCENGDAVDFYGELNEQVSFKNEFPKFSFCHFKSHFHVYAMKRAEIVADYAELEQSVLETRQQLTDAREAAAKDSSELDEMEKVNEELKTQIVRDNKKQTDLRDKQDKLKKRAHILKDEVETARFQLQNSEGEAAQLRMQVVSSPDRRKAEVATARQELDQMKTEVSKIEESSVRTKKCTNNIKAVLKDATTTIENLGELRKVCDNHSAISQQLDEATQDVAAKRGKEKELKSATEASEREVALAKENLEAEVEQHEVRMAALKEARDSAERKLLALQQGYQQETRRVKDAEKDVFRLQGEIDDAHSNTQEEVNQKTADYKVMEEAYLELDRSRMEQIRKSHVPHY